ncbi:cytochrome-c oxidase, cbb3-type subunit III [Ahrensia sp. 13_GOM-1096m]|uniref:cytochrome-c oxidase, cbb3-type subunit III n=1 Tax=Ahrensia sp. 13_GOM-1096m TaxID=1380380 RepID=UPI00047AF18B|nr:cytochrome-c oxidase, cbb3-type subunit III [Ahrensia sp. 13_GOM-1096m]
MSENNETDDITGVETTGHEWDGIKELNNPLPRSWLWGLYGTIVFSIGYVIAYPALPLINSSTAGLLGWSSRQNVANDIAALEQGRESLGQDLVATDLNKISGNPDLMQFALAGGNSAFKVYCSQCHGAGAAGGGIYPNLVDDDWIWGGTVDDIYLTLKHGIRYETDEDTRYSQMPNFGADGILERDAIKDAAWYVRSISGQEADLEAAERGAIVYQDNCAACHGDSGEGMHDLGAPALNDAIWLYGGSHEEIVAQISKPKQGVMPAWGDRLSEATIRQLALYVHRLGGGEK